MTVDELVKRFPEIPDDLRGEPVLERLCERFHAWLEIASKPSACSTEHTPANRAYLKLIGPIDIYRYGLSTQEKVVDQLEEHLASESADPAGFAASIETG